MNLQNLYTKFCTFLFVFLISALSSETFAFNSLPSDSFQFEGHMFNGDANILGVSVNIYLDNVKVTSTISNRYGDFHVFLKHNKTYIFEFIKKDFITEKFQIDTKVPEKLLKDGGIGEAYQNDYEILEFYDGIKVDMFNKPVRYFSYNPKSLFFEEDLKKSQTSKLTAVKNNILQVKNKLATAEKKNGDNFFKKQKYEEALFSYNKVLELTPDNQAVIDKVKETKKLLKARPEFENNYKALIKKADDYFKSKTFNDARDNYKMARVMKPEELYPANQLLIIDSLSAINYIVNKKEYDKIIVIADQNYKDKKLEDAQKNYESALALQVNVKYPQKQIDAIKATLAAEKKKKEDEAKANDEKYKGLIKKGDDFLAKANYLNALEIFKQALEVKPDDNYALLQKDKSEKLLVEANIEKIKKQKESDYNDTINLADKSFKGKDYNQALIYYNAALLIKPGEKYPAKKIKEINILKNKPADQNTNKVIPETEEAEKTVSKDSSLKEAGQDVSKLIGSAEELEKGGNKAGASKAYINIANLFHVSAELEKAMKFFKKALALLVQIDDKAGQSVVLNDMASVYYDSGQYSQTMLTYKEAFALKVQLGDTQGQAAVLSEMGEVLENTYQYEAASETLLQALAIQQKAVNNQSVSDLCNKLGGIYYSQGDFQKSINYFNKALSISQAANNKNSTGSLLNSLGVVYYKMGKYDEAIKYYNQSIVLDNETGNKKNLSLSYNNIGNINFNWNKYEKAIEFYQRSLSLKKELNFEQGMSASMYNIGNAYLELKNYSKAKEFLVSGLDLAKKLRFTEVMQMSYKALSRLYESTKDFQSAANSYKSFVSIMGPTTIAEGQFSEMVETYERESKLIKTLRHDLERQKFLTDYQVMQTLQKQKELQIKEVELKNQKAKTLRQEILLIFTIIFLIFAGALALQYYLRYQQKKKYSEVIGFQKQQITDSITYASRIQKAVFIPSDQMKLMFPQSFIFNRPKDVVSGDYFYMSVKDEKIYVAVADCTGHGVPGAFMSMLGISLIKEVLFQEKNLSANEVLNDLRDALMKALHQTGREDEAKDGMDIALCVIDFANMKLEFSGANNPCYLIRNKELIELKADRMPIGIHPVLKPFTSKPAHLEKGDSIYIFSDGFQDQIGEAINKKFKVGQFNKMLIELSAEPIGEQPGILEKTLNNWRGNEEQTDDILIVGIKV